MQINGYGWLSEQHTDVAQTANTCAKITGYLLEISVHDLQAKQNERLSQLSYRSKAEPLCVKLKKEAHHY